MAFTAEQRKQVARLPKDYFKAPKDYEGPKYKEMVEGKLEKLSPSQLRARVNITGVSWGRDIVVNYSAENDYTDEQKEAIGHGLKAGDKWAYKVAEIVEGGPSIEQRVKTLEG